MLDKQAQDVLMIELSPLTAIADYFVIATGSVDVHVKAIVDHVARSLRSVDGGDKPLQVEGYTNLSWVLMDYGDVVVHVFQPARREYYQLETLWGDAKVELIEDTSGGPGPNSL